MRHLLKPVLLWLVACLMLFYKAQAQRKEVQSKHAVWEALFTSIRFSGRNSVYADLHHINGGFTVARIGLVQHLPHRINATAGYSFAWLTVPGTGSDDLNRHEHRPWVQLFVPAAISQNLSIGTRLRYDMRFMQAVKDAELLPKYNLRNRIRLQETLRLNLPGLRIGPILPYLALSDEILLNVGRDTAHNTFDQNRLGLAMGLEFSELRLQAGYMNRYVKSASVPNRYTSNHNYTIWIFYTLDFRERQQETQLIEPR